MSQPVSFVHNYPAQLAVPVQFFDNSIAAPDAQITWSSDKAVPVVVSLYSVLGVKPLAVNENQTTADFVAQYLTDPVQQARNGARVGTLVLEYGTTAAQQRRVLDMRPGSIALPPCTFVKAKIRRWNGSAAPVNFDAVTVSLSIAAGLAPPDTPMPWCSVDFVSPFASLDVITPPGARFFRLVPTADPGDDVRLEAPGCVYDLANEVYMPPHGAWVAADDPVARDMSITKTGADNTALRLIWDIAT